MNCDRVAILCDLLALLSAEGGCQRKPTWDLAPVEGTVTKDGRPLANIQVIFRADLEAGTQGPRASGFTDAAGHYELRTDVDDRGAVPGRYRVCFRVVEKKIPLHLGHLGKDRAQQAERPKGDVSKPAASDTVKLPPAYGSFKETPLRVEVRKGAQVIDLEVK